jgi:hypothetical protein
MLLNSQVVRDQKQELPQLDHNGGNSKLMLADSLNKLPTVLFLMSQETKMSKEAKLSSTRDMVVRTRNGRSNMLIKPTSLKPRDSTKNSVSTSIDHSTSDHRCQ